MRSKRYSFFLILSIIFAACVPNETSESSPATEILSTQEPSSEPESEKIILQWWDYYSLPEVSQELDEAIALYEAKHPNIDIERRIIGFTELNEKILNSIDNGELPDIMLIDNPNHHALADAGALADLTEYIADWEDRDQYFAGAWNSTVYKGRNYGVPFESNAVALFYNKAMFADAGLTEPPTTWTELREQAKRLTTDGRYGFCLETSASEGGTFYFLPFLWQAGGDVPTIGDEASLNALSFLRGIVTDGSITSEPISGGQVYDLFASSRCAMMINGPWQLPNFVNDNVTFAWDVAPLPQNVEAASALGGENFAIGARKNVEAAWAVIDWITDPEHLKKPLLAVGLPNRQDMTNDPDWINDPQIKVFIDQVAIARARAYGPNYPEISQHISHMYRQVIEGARTPEEAVSEAQTAIAPLLP